MKSFALFYAEISLPYFEDAPQEDRPNYDD